MKITCIPLCLASAFAFASCVSTDTALQPGIDHGELASELSKPKVRFSKVRIVCKIITGDKTESLSPVLLRRGRSASSSLTSEGIYPTAFEFPEVKDGNGDSFPITPANPTAFESDQFGWNLKLKADTRDGFIMLSGTLNERRMGTKIRAAGAPFEPITTQATNALGRKVAVTLTDNRAEQPTIINKEIPILIAASNGGNYRVFLDEEKTTYAEFSCQVID